MVFYKTLLIKTKIEPYSLTIKNNFVQSIKQKARQTISGLFYVLCFGVTCQPYLQTRFHHSV